MAGDVARTGRTAAKRIAWCPSCWQDTALKPHQTVIPPHDLDGGTQECPGSGRPVNEDAVRIAGALTAFRSRAQGGKAVSPDDVLRLCEAVKTVVQYLSSPVMDNCLRVPGTETNYAHVREHERWNKCDCPGSIPLMWPADPEKILDLLACLAPGPVMREVPPGRTAGNGGLDR